MLFPRTGHLPQAVKFMHRRVLSTTAVVKELRTEPVFRDER